MAICSPYSIAEVPEISYAQVGDVVYLAHENHPLYKITRSGNVGSYCWELTNVALNQSLTCPINVQVTPTCGMVCGCCDWNSSAGCYNCCYCCEYAMNLCSCLGYKVSAVDCDGIESLPSSARCIMFRYPTDWVAGDHVTVCWNSVTGACEYNIYRDSAGYYGLIGVACGCTRFVDENYEPDMTVTPKEDWNPFESDNTRTTRDSTSPATKKEAPSGILINKSANY